MEREKEIFEEVKRMEREIEIEMEREMEENKVERENYIILESILGKEWGSFLEKKNWGGMTCILGDYLVGVELLYDILGIGEKEKDEILREWYEHVFVDNKFEKIENFIKERFEGVE